MQTEWPDYHFSLEEYDQRTTFESGIYKVRLLGGEWHFNKKGTGKHLSLEFCHIEPPYMDDIFYENLNLQHIKKDTCRRSEKKLSHLLRAINLSHLDEYKIKDRELYVEIESILDNCNIRFFYSLETGLKKQEELKTSLILQNEHSYKTTHKPL